jgi:hypothetical protein
MLVTDKALLEELLQKVRSSNPLQAERALFLEGGTSRNIYTDECWLGTRPCWNSCFERWKARSPCRKERFVEYKALLEELLQKRGKLESSAGEKRPCFLGGQQTAT